MKRAKNNKIQVSQDHYYNLKYDTKERWMSYWYQVKEVLSFEPQTVLEIGVGNMTVSDYLKKLGIKITTCDFDKNLKPDVVASVLSLPFKKNSFDVVLCAEVLEHLPFDCFNKALLEIRRVCKKSTILTLPHFSITHLYLGIKAVPFIPKKEFMLKVDFPIKHKFLGEHYWEIGKSGYSLRKIENKIKKSGFKIKKSYYPKENPFHHFFILIK
ncbi:MAG: Methyltransferase type 11 [Berkelbacteria bacterium GW2011_GWA1_36_9]|uniref:Methyltransferase type 11 n=1 Tax=Berkelbacteria bacterium GW2011_GWA1_36_9 TaxID=1618331 RepID=A0A0G0I1R3_9BACT|nr:MAG: Methyltransferase type 11 [Berkelbacteria bacterium GW2011_GWA1_36_9]